MIWIYLIVVVYDMWPRSLISFWKNFRFALCLVLGSSHWASSIDCSFAGIWCFSFSFWHMSSRQMMQSVFLQKELRYVSTWDCVVFLGIFCILSAICANHKIQVKTFSVSWNFKIKKKKDEGNGLICSFFFFESINNLTCLSESVYHAKSHIKIGLVVEKRCQLSHYLSTWYVVRFQI